MKGPFHFTVVRVVHMKRNAYEGLKDQLDALTRRIDELDVEFWFARELMAVLGYSRWENFVVALHRAITSCNSMGHDPEDHFRGVTKMIPLAKGAQRSVDDFMLTRYACYLIAQNGDPRKQEIAFAQGYFAVQTRKLELIEERIRLHARLDARERLRESERQISKRLFDRGVDEHGFARIRSSGDAALFGGLSTQQMKQRYGVTKSRPLADFLPALVIAAKNLANEMTTVNIEQLNLHGEDPICSEHVLNNLSVRSTLNERGIKPEDLPAEEDIRKSERRIQRETKTLGQAGKLP
jgi:DNA-damage-inducible protein D